MTSTLAEWLDEASDTFQDSAALIADSRVIGFAELADMSRTIARDLSGRGVGKGDRVAVWLLNEPEWLAIFFACARIGAIAVAVNTRFRAAELSDIFARTRPKAIFYRSKFRSTDFAALIDEAGRISAAPPPVQIAIGQDADFSTGSRGDPGPEYAISPGDLPDVEDGAVMFTTSGTTSAPKFVLHPHRSVVEHAFDVAADFEMSGPGAVMLQALPYCGVFGFCQAMAALAAGRPSVVLETFDPATAVAAIADHRVTHFNATDDMLAAMAGAAPAETFSTLRLVGAASFNRGPDALARLADSHDLPIVGLYGMSEVQALYARRQLGDPPDRRFAAGGRPVSRRARVRVRDPGSGALLPSSESGELELQGPSKLCGYFGDDAATAAAATKDGFVRTGDLGFLEKNGSFTFESRMGDALRLGGFMVNPDEISGFIENLDGIEECVVVGVVSEGTLRPAAFVKTDKNQLFDREVVLRSCARGLAAFKVPVLIHALGEFPVADGPNGAKIQRGVLRELARELVEK